MLPIITPPFVIGLGIILLFGRSGVATVRSSATGSASRPSRWIYGFSGLLLVQALAFTPIAYLVLIGVVKASARRWRRRRRRFAPTAGGLSAP